jgi:putative flippase GtrA
MELFLKFALTGGIGTVSNLLLFFVLVDVFRLPAMPSSVACYFAAATQNYFVNHYWVFRDGRRQPASFYLWWRFILGSTGGLVVNLVILKLSFSWFSMAVYSQFFGIAIGLVINFMIAKLFVFR